MEALASLGLLRLPQPFLASRPLALDGAPWPPVTYLGLPPDAVSRLTLIRPVDYVLTVENFTSFVRHAREVNQERGGLVLYSGGFPSRGALQAIVHLADRAKAPTFHWGGIDAGGLRVFRYLEAALRARGVMLRAHLMRADLFAETQGRAGGRRSRPAPPPAVRSPSYGTPWRRDPEAGGSSRMRSIRRCRVSRRRRWAHRPALTWLRFRGGFGGTCWRSRRA